MDKTWINKVDENIPDYFETLQKNNSRYQIKPMEKGMTSVGKKIELGYSCFALKSYFITGRWKNLSDKEKNEWTSFIKRFQKNDNRFPSNSFIDPELINDYDNFNLNRDSKRVIKKILSLSDKNKYINHETNLQNAVKAETKQAISSLVQVNEREFREYNNFPNSYEDINNYLNSLNWKYPWSAGAQFAGLCVFVSCLNNIDLKNELTGYLSTFADSIVNNDGAYYKGEQPNSSEVINGAMKMFSGFDWIDKKIHHPEKIIDLALSIKPSHEGCDLVDIVYVLFMASKQVTYRRKEVQKYCEELIPVIKLHYFEEKGGFSYYLNRSQKYYYGLNISKGLNTPDIHGTTLLLWALSMIFKLCDFEELKWNTLKP
jgi:hypothetical protein